MKTGDTIEIRIDDIGANGEGIGHLGEMTVFIPFALPGETVSAKINHIKNNLVFAGLTKISEPSGDRVKPVCPLFTRCGGCDFLHLEYAAQLKYKKQNLENILRKNAGINIRIDDIVPSEPLYYRNKIQLPFGVKEGKAVLGFYREKTHKIIPLEKCYLHAGWAEKLIKTVLSFVNEEKLPVYDETTGKGLLRHLVGRYINGFLSVTLVINGDKVKNINKLADALNKEFNSVSLYLSVNRQKNNVIMGDKIIPIRAERQVIDIMGVKVDINPMSFFQINDDIRDKIYRRVEEIVNPSPDTLVIDAYSGIGLLGAILAKKGARIYNIEIVPEAVEDARRLYEANGIARLADNILGDAAKELPALLSSDAFKSRLNPSSTLYIILDPPRKGLDVALPPVLNSLSAPVPLNLIYISCNPATLSRDLSLLTKNDNYTILSLTPYDMFPSTHHVECVVLITRKND